MPFRRLNDNAIPARNMTDDNTRANFKGNGIQGKTASSAKTSSQKKRLTAILPTIPENKGAIMQKNNRYLTYHNGGFAAGTWQEIPNSRKKSKLPNPNAHQMKYGTTSVRSLFFSCVAYQSCSPILLA